MTGNRYPNGILFIPTEIEELRAGDLAGVYAVDAQLRPAVVRIPAALVPKGELSPAVLAGEACVRCGGLLGPMVPCGTGPEGAIFVHDPLCENSAWTVADQLEFYRQHYLEYVALWGGTGREVIRLASEGRWFDLLEMVGDGLNARDAANDASVEAYPVAVRKAKVAQTVNNLRAAARELAERLPDDGLDEDLRHVKEALEAGDEADAEEPGEIDLGTCPYFARHERLPGYDPEATCGFGCIDEPACVTCEPDGGWPSRSPKADPAITANPEEGLTRYRVVYEVSAPNRIPREEHVALAIGVTAAADCLPDRVYRLDGSEWVQVYDEAGP